MVLLVYCCNFEYCLPLHGEMIGYMFHCMRRTAGLSMRCCSLWQMGFHLGVDKDDDTGTYSDGIMMHDRAEYMTIVARLNTSWQTMNLNSADWLFIQCTHSLSNLSSSCRHIGTHKKSNIQHFTPDLLSQSCCRTSYLTIVYFITRPAWPCHLLKLNDSC